MTRRAFFSLFGSALAVLGFGTVAKPERAPLGRVVWRPTAKQVEFMNSPARRVFTVGRGGRTAAAIHARAAQLRREIARQVQEQIWANPPKGLF